MAGFNGEYDVNVGEKQLLSKAHVEALELLGIIHRICSEKQLTYSLIGNALIAHVKGKPFAELSPEIALAMKHELLQVLRAELEKYCEENKEYILIDNKNSRQFDSLELWFAKRNKVNLPEERKKDEIYYYTYVSIFPVFYAGNNRREFSHTKKVYIKAQKALNARAPLPQRTLRVKIRIIKRIIRDAWYRRKREGVSLVEIERVLAENKKATSLCFLPISVIADVVKITTPEIENVQLVDFGGQECYVSQYATDIVERYSKKDQETVLKRRVSDLIRNGGEDLRRVQLVQTEMLIEFDRVCRKNNIRYNIAFGTLLGAVRHGGFIPWDDDVDVIVPYDDYLKLDLAMKKDLDTSRFFWRTIDTEVDFNLTFKHMKRNGTVYMKPGRDNFNFHKGVLIDVFPVFPSANNRLAHWIQTRLCFFYRTATWAYMGASSEKSKIKRAIYNWMKKPGPRKNLDSFMKAATMYKKKNPYYSYYNAQFRSPYHINYLSDEAFDSSIELEFEGHKFLAPCNYEAALSYCFSTDYNLYPPVRKPTHFAIVELGEMFTDFGEKGEANT